MSSSLWPFSRRKVGHLAGRLTEDIVDLLRLSQEAELEKQMAGNVYRTGVSEIERPPVAPKFFIPLKTWQMDEPFTSELGTLALINCTILLSRPCGWTSRSRVSKLHPARPEWQTDEPFTSESGTEYLGQMATDTENRPFIHTAFLS